MRFRVKSLKRKHNERWREWKKKKKKNNKLKP